MKAIKLLILVITFLLIVDVKLNATAMFDVTFKITVFTKLAYTLGEETPGGVRPQGTAPVRGSPARGHSDDYSGPIPMLWTQQADNQDVDCKTYQILNYNHNVFKEG